MSSILKALKKLEHEKASHMTGSLNIDSEILRTVDSSRNFFTPAFALIILLFFGGGAAVAYFFMKESKVPLAATTLQASITSPSLRPAPAVGPEVLPAEIIVIPARKETSGEVSRQRHNTTDSGKSAESVTRKTEKESAASILLTPKKGAGTLQSELPVPTIPALRVNGIAFQVNGADNMAIINGTAVANGSIIEGVTVVEVRKDYVLLQYNGEKFEIQLGQSNK